MQKEMFPGGFDIATGGCQGADESNELGASRELEEEMGIKRSESELKLLKSFFF